MRALQERTGYPPRRILSNSFPVLVTAEKGILSASRVSGVPQSQRASHEPIIVDEVHLALFLQRGDHVMLQVAEGENYRRKYVAVAPDLGARLIISDDPIATSPESGMPRDFDTARLLAIARDRELSQVEQFFAAMTMPKIWKAHGGGPVPALLAPTTADARECERFAREFVQSEQKLAAIAKLSPEWSAVLSVESTESVTAERKPTQRPRL